MKTKAEYYFEQGAKAMQARVAAFVAMVDEANHLLLSGSILTLDLPDFALPEEMTITSED